MLTSRAHASRLLFFFFILANLASLTAASHPADQRHEHHQGPLLNPGEAIASGSDQQHPPLAAVADAELLLPFAGPLAPAAPAAPEAMSSSLARTAPLVFPAAGKHTATVIFAHGLGDTGHGWASAVENWRRRQRLDEVKFVLPHAPQIPITCNWGMRMPGWFDIVSRNTIFDRHRRQASSSSPASSSSSSSSPLTVPQKRLDGTVESLRESEDEPGIRASSEYFQSLVQAEVDAGIPAERIVLGGFSQGGAMAIFSGLTGPHRIGGIVGLSCWLPLSNKFAGIVAAGSPSQDTPVWLGHGDADPLVRPELGELSAEALKKLGFKVSRTLYPGMPHAACPEELDDVEAFLRERLPPTKQ
ncbi:phospholipase/Carboxylesterase [Colletotrichum higginsianum IMI 349063]|uniref:Acyl-protein thioesterase 1 n=1 Tax=Colletotrichum higginsianum (strain IMI 349063) TaxID=759273 RepID=A0A1B7Y996_COLHI|nr:phospholipase/Carboxylesterase [Colletotrichum higginsianum IMI 349063]OBR08547.1 phospholipase/Carboxylesterase [Colletotrichum higginsianum IMI 349063]